MFEEIFGKLDAETKNQESEIISQYEKLAEIFKYLSA